MAKKKYIIFGASKMGEVALSIIKWNDEIINFCDNDEEKWHTSFFGLSVLSPSELLDLYDPDIHCIVIASMYHVNISAQLVRMGIGEFKVFKYDLEQNDQHIRNYQKGLIDFINSNNGGNGSSLQIDPRPEREITAIVVTKDRPEKAERCIEYYHRMNGPDLNVRILVLDASRRGVAERIQRFVDTYRGGNVLYKSFDPDVNPVKKGLIGLDFATTEYCAWCADDDYYLREGIIKSIDFLKCHPDFIGTKGRVSFFENGDLGRIFYLDKFPISRDIDEDRPIDRMRNFFQSDKMCNLAYVVFRRRLMTMLRAVIFKHEEAYLGSNFGFVEYINDIMIAGSGKIKDIGCDLSLRDMDKDSLSFMGQTLKDAVYDGSFNENFFKAAEVLCEFTRTYFSDHLDLEQAFHIFSEFLVNYCDIERRFVKYSLAGFDLPLLIKGFGLNEHWQKVRNN